MRASFLLDVNVLLALAWPNHQFHRQSRVWYQRQGRRGWSTCPTTQLGFIRLSSNPAYSPHAKTPLEATLLLKQLTNQPGHRFIDELPAPTSETFEAVARNLLGHRQTTDAYLITIAKERGLRLTTFDQRVVSFCPFEGIVQLLPI